MEAISSGVSPQSQNFRRRIMDLSFVDQKISFRVRISTLVYLKVIEVCFRGISSMISGFLGRPRLGGGFFTTFFFFVSASRASLS